MKTIQEILVNDCYYAFINVTDIMELKRMMEKLGQAKTHVELKKMISEVDTTKKGSDRCLVH